MLCYAIPTSHFPSSSRPSRYTSSSPYRCSPATYLASDEEEQYYEYLDAVRRQRERRELEQVQAERWARQEAARVQEQEARRAAYIEYQQYLQQQHQERLRAQAVAEARAQAVAQAKAQAIAQARARAIAEYQAREHAKAIEAKQQQKRQQEQALRRQIMDHIIRSIVAAASTPDTPTPTQTLPAPAAAQQRESRPKATFSSYVHIIPAHSTEETAVRQRLQQVQAIQARLDDARKAFVEPETLVFDASATSSSPKLAYSPLNRPAQVLEETLTKLLIDLDTITSDGHQQVKTARKQLAVAIEEELTKLESIKSAIWSKQNKSTQEPEGSTEALKAEEAAPAATFEEKAAEEAELPTYTQETSIDTEKVEETHHGEKTVTVTEPEAPLLEQTADPVSEPIPSAEPERQEDKAEELVTHGGSDQQDAPVKSSSAIEIGDSAQPTTSPATADTDSVLPPSSQLSTIEQEESTEHIEAAEEPKTPEETVSTNDMSAEAPHSPSLDCSQPSSLSVTVTDDEDEGEAVSPAYQDISKAFQAEVKPASSETDAGDTVAEDASSESSFEML